MTKRQDLKLYVIWAHVRKNTDETLFVTFESFKQSIPDLPKHTKGRVSFVRDDKSSPYSLSNGAWAVYQHLPPQQAFDDPYKGAPTSSEVTCLGRRTETLFNFLCNKTGLTFALPLTKAGTAPPCPCCEVLDLPQGIPPPVKRRASPKAADERQRLARLKKTMSRSELARAKRVEQDMAEQGVPHAERAKLRAEYNLYLEQPQDALEQPQDPAPAPAPKQSDWDFENHTPLLQGTGESPYWDISTSAERAKPLL